MFEFVSYTAEAAEGQHIESMFAICLMQYFHVYLFSQNTGHFQENSIKSVQ